MVSGPQVERDVRTACRRVGGRDLLVPPFAARGSRLALRFGAFVASEHFFVGQGRHYRDSEDYESAVYATGRSRGEGGPRGRWRNPGETALETLRELRDTLRMAIEFRGLTLSSILTSSPTLQSRLPVCGRPAGVPSQQLPALGSTQASSSSPSARLRSCCRRRVASSWFIPPRSSALTKWLSTARPSASRPALGEGVRIAAAHQPGQAWPGPAS
jgi:hypothetical protein